MGQILIRGVAPGVIRRLKSRARRHRRSLEAELRESDAAKATIEEARTAASTLRALPLSVYPSQSLIEPALEIAHRSGRNVYDSLYVALAVWHRHPLVTADRRLYDALRRGPFAAQLLWVEDIE